jgi:hypothetical protein
VTAPAKRRTALQDNAGKATAVRGAAPAKRRAQRELAGERAAKEVLERHTVAITLPDDWGVIRLPEPRRCAYYAGLAVLAAFGVLDWPVAAVLGIGHLLAEDHHHRVLAEFGEALAEA